MRSKSVYMDLLMPQDTSFGCFGSFNSIRPPLGDPAGADPTLRLVSRWLITRRVSSLELQTTSNPSVFLWMALLNAHICPNHCDGLQDLVMPPPGSIPLQVPFLQQLRVPHWEHIVATLVTATSFKSVNICEFEGHEKSMPWCFLNGIHRQIICFVQE